jgi:hypothetical protein
MELGGAMKDLGSHWASFLYGVGLVFIVVWIGVLVITLAVILITGLGFGTFVGDPQLAPTSRIILASLCGTAILWLSGFFVGGEWLN